VPPLVTVRLFAPLMDELAELRVAKSQSPAAAKTIAGCAAGVIERFSLHRRQTAEGHVDGS